MQDAVGILAAQIEILRLKSMTQLGDKDVKALLQYINGLTSLSREEREREKASDLADRLDNMSNEELLQYAEQQLKAVK